MKRYAYILERENNSVESELQMMYSYGCEIFRDAGKNEKHRPYWKYIVGELQSGDELYIVSFENAFRGVREMSFFLIYCIKNNISLISIGDGVRTTNKEHLAVFMAIKKLTEGVSDIRRESNILKTEENHIEPSKRISDLKAEVAIVNMYESGFSIDEIIKNVKYKSKATVYTILRRNGISPNRCVHRNKKVSDVKSK